MTFDEWAELLDLKGDTFSGFPPKPGIKGAWRCTGPCGQLMYGLELHKNWYYPTIKNLPVGNYISKEFPLVCQLCHNLYYYYIGHPDDKVQDRIQAYWDAIRSADNKRYQRLKREGDFFAS